MRKFIAALLLLAGCTIPTATPPAPTADTIELYYPPTITVTPWSPVNAHPVIWCMLQHFDFEWSPGRITIYRRDKAGYFECILRRNV